MYLYVDSFRGHERVVYKICMRLPTNVNEFLPISSEFVSSEYMEERDGMTIMRVCAPDQPHQLYVYSTTNRKIVSEESIMSTSKRILQDLIHMESIETKHGGHALLYTTPQSLNCSMIVLLHGGPHNLFHACFNPDILFYLSHHYAVLVPNYHGSVGYGDDYMHSLCGHLGEIEVNDVIEAIDSIRQTHHRMIDFSRLYVMGSSYGGFMCLHLLEKYPTLFSKAIIRNPVADLVAMLTTTDMSYWTLTLTGIIPSRGQWTEKANDAVAGKYIYSSEDLIICNQFNPIVALRQIVTPICFILGGKDTRVVNQQTLEVFRILNALKRPIKLLVNDADNHYLRLPLTNMMTSAEVVEFFT